MQLYGVSGELRVGYQQAALLGKWEMQVPTSLENVFEATLRQVDEYWITQRPLILVLHINAKQWRWTLDGEIDRSGGKVRFAVKGKPQVR